MYLTSNLPCRRKEALWNVSPCVMQFLIEWRLGPKIARTLWINRHSTLKVMANTHTVKEEERSRKNSLTSFPRQPAWLLQVNHRHQLVWMPAFVEMKWLISVLAPKLRHFSRLPNNLLSQNTCGDPRQESLRGVLDAMKNRCCTFWPCNTPFSLWSKG